MPKPKTTFTDLMIRNAHQSVTETGGLKLHVTPSGGRVWHWRTSFNTKPITVSLGVYPQVALAEARRRLNEAKMILGSGQDPTQHKWASAAPTGRNLENELTDWYDREAASGRWNGSPDVWRSVERDVIPAIGKLHISTITPAILKSVTDAILKRGSIETAHRVAKRLEWFFDYAEASELIKADPSVKLKRTLPKIPKSTKRPAIIEMEPAREMLRKVESQIAFPVTKLAHRFHALTAARPGMTAGAEWAEMIDLDGPNPIWRLPANRMKGELAFDIPLAPAAVEILAAIRPVSGKLRYVFRGNQTPTKPMSDGAINKLLHTAGYKGEHVAHGWRSTFSTIMNTLHPEFDTIIEVCLAHADETVKGKVGAAYNRATYIAQRRELLTEWASMLLADQKPLSELLTGPKRRVGRYARVMT
jgi:integrase